MQSKQQLFMFIKIFSSLGVLLNLGYYSMSSGNLGNIVSTLFFGGIFVMTYRFGK